LILPGLFFESHDRHPFADEGAREVPVDLHYATMEQDDVTYRLPAGMKLESLPTDPGVEWAGGVKLAIQATRGDGSVTVTRSFERSAAMLDVSLYNALRFVYRRIARADQQQIVLSRAEEVSSN